MISQIMRYEEGLLTENETIDLFAELVKSGLAWGLQGSYGRMAVGLIEEGYISPEGEVLHYIEEDV